LGISNRLRIYISLDSSLVLAEQHVFRRQLQLGTIPKILERPPTCNFLWRTVLAITKVYPHQSTFCRNAHLVQYERSGSLAASS
jgi:hypothetical protein